MTLQASGEIDIRDINLELQRAAGTTFDINSGLVRALAKKQTSGSEISFRDFWGKSYITQAMVVDTFSTYRSKLFDWVLGGSGDTRFVNNPGSNRNTGSFLWTKTFSMDGITLPDTNWVTIVITLSGKSPSFDYYTINNGSIASTYTTEVYSAFEQRQRVLQVNTTYRAITSVAVAWSYTAANAGSWASIAVIPGRWSGYNHTLQNARTVSDKAVGRDTIHIGSYYGGPNGPMTFVEPADISGTSPMQRFDGWWYNNGGFYTAINGGLTSTYYDVVAGTSGTVNSTAFHTMSEP